MPYERLDEMVILVAFLDSLVKELALFFYWKTKELVTKQSSAILVTAQLH